LSSLVESNLKIDFSNIKAKMMETTNFEMGGFLTGCPSEQDTTIFVTNGSK